MSKAELLNILRELIDPAVILTYHRPGTWRVHGTYYVDHERLMDNINAAIETAAAEEQASKHIGDEYL